MSGTISLTCDEKLELELSIQLSIAKFTELKAHVEELLEIGRDSEYYHSEIAYVQKRIDTLNVLLNKVNNA